MRRSRLRGMWMCVRGVSGEERGAGAAGGAMARLVALWVSCVDSGGAYSRTPT